MFTVSQRVPRAIVIAAAAIVVVACSDQATAPGSSPAVRSNIVLAPAYIIDTGPGGTNSIGSSAMFASGSTTCSPQPACAGHFQELAGRFTLTRGANVQSVEGWMSVGVAGTLDVHIRSDSTPAAGPHIPGHSLDSVRYSVGTQVYGWKAFSSNVVSLPAGTYWVTFEPVPNGLFNGGMTGPAAAPLADYAFFADGNNRWVAYSQFSQNPALGFRVYGETVLTPTDQINDLMAYVSASGIPRPNVSKINGSLEKAVTALGANQTATACAYLQDVVDYTQKQSVRKIPASVSAEIISKTNATRTDVGC
jgi:hypothetical protein